MYKQRLHVKIFFKMFLNSIKLFLLFSTEISSTEYRYVAYVQYRDVLIPSEWSDMSSHRLLFQCTSSIKIELSVLV
jgi:hypothetical protein